MTSPERLLAEIPAVDRLLASEWAAALLQRHARAFVVECVRRACDDVRRAIQEGRLEHAVGREIAERVAADVARHALPRPRPVVNATGVVLHTNLGRALLPEEAVEALVAAARRPLALEFDVGSGRRGDRDEAVADDLRALTGAEAATVVNNNAAAVLLALNTLAEGRDVVVSRGELVEIGGSFRIPEVLAKSGARLVEVGTTNRTHRSDYERAIGPATACLLKVHTSNYRIVGFTAEVALDELVLVGRAHGLPVVEDLGSGALVDLTAYGVAKEPVVRERVAAGADLVTFSGDKLLGGPQAGILVGRREIVERLKRNPLRRALRPGKLALSALAAVLRLYRASPRLAEALPTLRALSRSLDELERVGEAAAARLRALLPGARVEVEDSSAEIGSGALPATSLASKAIAIRSSAESADALARRFREADPPIVGRVQDGRFLLDLRCIFDAAELVPRF